MHFLPLLLILLPLTVLALSTQDKQLVTVIDSISNRFYEDHFIKKPPITNDYVFLRRIYLDIAGRIPSAEETVNFLEDKNTNKRSILIQSLLDSSAYASHFYNKWADVLRIKTQGQIRQGGGNHEYAEWLKNALEENMLYDQLVWQLITSEGHPWENGATGFYFRDFGMPLDHMATTMQIFLGSRIACAQCHNHPYESWTQKQFFELSAFTYGNKTQYPIFRNKTVQAVQNILDEKSAGNKEKQLGKQLVRQTMQPLRYRLYETKDPIKLPSEYAYSDAKPDSIVHPRVPFGNIPEVQGKTPILQFAEWLTSEDNKNFSIVITNRLFSWLMGRGLIEPIDHISTDGYESSMPDLTNFLADLMPLIQYDMKRFIGILANTNLYQSQSYPGIELKHGVPFQPGKRSIRRMSAEQIWDSLLTIMNPNIDHSPKISDRRALQDQAVLKVISELTPDEIAEFYHDFIKKNTNYQASDNSGRNIVQQFRRHFSELAKQAGLDIKAQMNAEQKMIRKSRNGMVPDLQRASNLPSPVRQGHFLETFGQSDRELVDNSTSQAAIPQALELLNSHFINNRVLKNSSLSQYWKKNNNTSRVLDQIFLTLLSRYPTDLEKDFLRNIKSELNSVGANKNQIFEDITAGIINSQKFLFIE